MSEFETQDEYELKKREVISKFSIDFMKGYYFEDAELNTIIESLVRGANIYKIVEQLVANRKKLMETLLKIMQNSTFHQH